MREGTKREGLEAGNSPRGVCAAIFRLPRAREGKKGAASSRLGASTNAIMVPYAMGGGRTTAFD